jgi:uncharacterized protein
MGFVLDLRHLGEGVNRLSEVVSPDDLGLVWSGLSFRPEIRVQLVVGRAGEDLDIAMRYEGERQGECDRCLKPYREAFAGSLRAIARRASPHHELAGQDGVLFHDGHHLDLSAEVRESIIVDIPIQRLCTPGCLGLCPTCGADRNAGSCDCHVDRVDPRWERLREARGLG